MPSDPNRAVSHRAVSRRRFLRLGGVAASAAVLAACDSDNEDNDGIEPEDEVVFDFATDFGVLNFALALAQAQAALYTTTTQAPYVGAQTEEQALLDQMLAHENDHRRFLRTAIETAGATPIPALRVDLRTVSFTDRTSVLTTAQQLEDLSVAAYNAAALAVSDPDWLTILGKIVSVEARHATAIRGLIGGDTLFAIGAEDDLATQAVDPGTGLERASSLAEILDRAAPFFTAPLRAVNLPS
ncbi:MAG: ferritin-like domain-containing protein [Bacteroidota bacterium]